MRVCIVNHVGPSLNPRMVKEADALVEAGHYVRVVSVDSSRLDDADSELVSRRGWTYCPVDYSPRKPIGLMRWMVSGIKCRASRSLARISASQRIAEGGFCRYRDGQMKIILKEPADLYIAHNLQNLPVAAAAAATSGASLGFDMEDYHADEDSPPTRDPIVQRFKEQILNLYLPQCAHLSVTSEAMADEVERRFPVSRPMVLYNSFPLAYAEGIAEPQACNAKRDRYTAYWFSQVVGLDRGLQDFIQALPHLSSQVELHIRGRASDSVKRELVELAQSLGAEHRVVFHDPIYAEDLVR